MENNAPEGTPESLRGLLTQMESLVSLGDEIRVKEAEQDDKALQLGEALCAQPCVSWLEGGSVAE